ncbi:hypothetical protein [Streptomyces iconiensis]|uniref:Uncharacterized protein n=1 Tax=Streptomyces iconiensis TaxID=1384038 RepID=A0ABT6ZY94_9ACTN|nr:hypothetical protein [Streptomyces iconiensis]MDJ1134031.1 hypothetical protein [Streptomyces iconiensis]
MAERHDRAQADADAAVGAMTVRRAGAVTRGVHARVEWASELGL